MNHYLPKLFNQIVSNSPGCQDAAGLEGAGFLLHPLKSWSTEQILPTFRDFHEFIMI
jgi:hypothetical protein